MEDNAPLPQTQTAIVTPVEDGFDVAVASQDINQIQNIVAMAMAVPSNSVNVTVRRLGGSYGGKISLPNHVSDGCYNESPLFLLSGCCCCRRGSQRGEETCEALGAT